jgi:hypothetical protein
MTARNLPNLIIAGVSKAGTTSLFSYLSRHPDICPSIIKETCYFLPLRYSEEMSSIEEYMNYFSSCKAQKYYMEATPGYFYGGEKVALAIKEQLPEAKIILIFRDPVDRFYSFYRYLKGTMKIDRELTIEKYFNKCDKIIDPSKKETREQWIYRGIIEGFYSDYLKVWLNIFGKDVKILFFEELKENPLELLKKSSIFLDIDGNIFSSVGCEVENRSVSYKNKSFHNIALWINKKGERFWRKHYKLKTRLRKLYYFFNEKPNNAEPIPDKLPELQKIYEKYNRRLFNDLSLMGYTELPKWVRGLQ